MTILVTGATGFVMSGVVRHLAERGQTVVAADLNEPDEALRAYLSGLPGEVTFRQLDVAEPDGVQAFVREARPAGVVHGAAITAIPEDMERARFVRTSQVNVMGTLHVLDALREVGTGRIVVVSSGSIYGPRPDLAPIDEDDPGNPRGLYPTTKWAAECLARRYGEINRLDLAVVRLCSPFGPFERDTGSRPLLSAVRTWAVAALGGEPMRVQGSPDAVRDIAYVADVGSGIGAVLLAESLPERTFNVGWGRSASAREVVETLARVVPGARYEVADEPSPWVNASNAVRGPLRTDRLRALGWSPRYDLESGLAAYVAWLRAQATAG